MAHGRMKTSSSPISLMTYERCVGNQHTAHVHRGLPMARCFAGNLIRCSKRRGAARHLFWQSSVPGLGYSLTALSCVCVTADAWKSLTDKVQEARSNARLKQLSFAGNIQCQTRFCCAFEGVRANRSSCQHLKVQSLKSCELLYGGQLLPDEMIENSCGARTS